MANTKEFDKGNCAAMTGVTSTVALPYSLIRTSEEVKCIAPGSNGSTISAIAISWVQGNLFVGLVGVRNSKAVINSVSFNSVARKFEASLRASGIS